MTKAANSGVRIFMASTMDQAPVFAGSEISCAQLEFSAALPRV